MTTTLTLWTGFPTTTRTPIATVHGAPGTARLDELRAAGMLAAAPVIGLAFIVLLPLGGLALLAALAARALIHSTRARHALKDIALFFAAPFVGLAYVVLTPLVGLVVLGWMACQALARSRAVRTVALAAGAPFIGLAYVLLLPVAGIAMLATLEWRALVTTARAA